MLIRCLSLLFNKPPLTTESCHKISPELSLLQADPPALPVCLHREDGSFSALAAHSTSCPSEVSWSLLPPTVWVTAWFKKPLGRCMRGGSQAALARLCCGAGASVLNGETGAVHSQYCHHFPSHPVLEQSQSTP